MFLRTDNPSFIEIAFNKSFLLYEDDIVKLHERMWKEEDIYGESCNAELIMQYYIAIGVATLIYIEAQELIHPPLEDWSYYKSKYCLTSFKESLACKGIDLNKILSYFGLPKVEDEDSADGDGINAMGIEVNFEVEPEGDESITVSTTGVLDFLLAQGKTCTVLFNSTCPYPAINP